MRALLNPRGLLALVAAVVLAGAAGLDAARASITEINPLLAEKLPGNTAAKVDVLSLLLGQPSAMPEREEIMDVARARLREEPLDASALNLMAYAADPTGRTGVATAYADLATQVSKRMTFSQLAMTFVALQKGDVPATIDRFDAVLRARPQAEAMFFPYLKQALFEPEIRQAIADLAVADAPWVMGFLSSAGNDSAFTPLAADVMLRGGTRIPETDRATYAGAMLSHAFDDGHYAAARRLVALIPGGSARLFETPAITATSTDPRFGRGAWQLASASTGSASAVRASGAPALSFYATGGAKDVLATKFLMLRPGVYAASHILETGAAAEASAAVRWALVCQQSERRVWQSDNVLAQPSARRLGRVAIPDDCRVQRLQLEADVAFGRPAVDFTLRSISLTQAERRGA